MEPAPVEAEVPDLSQVAAEVTGLIEASGPIESLKGSLGSTVLSEPREPREPPQEPQEQTNGPPEPQEQQTNILSPPHPEPPYSPVHPKVEGKEGRQEHCRNLQFYDRDLPSPLDPAAAASETALERCGSPLETDPFAPHYEYDHGAQDLDVSQQQLAPAFGSTVASTSTH